MAREPSSRPRPRRVALVSLGCPKNQVDSELILGRLTSAGCSIVEDPDDADILVVNTCSFIDRARAESVEALLEGAAWKAARPGRRLVAAGCLVQRSAAELTAELPEIDSLIGLDDLSQADARSFSPRLPALPAGPSRAVFSHADPRVRLGPAHTAYVKIAEGCDQRCAFCAIPTFRGRTRSRPIADLAAEVGALAREGVVEINLIAQDSTGYGRDIGLREGLAALVRALDGLEDAPPWIRLHYLYPGRISKALLDALAGAKRFVPYIDLPLQHAHPAVLRRMNRPGNAETHIRQLDELERTLPGAGVRSSFIVGFPGETEDEFRALADFVAAERFDAVGVFTYSHEEQTASFALEDDIPAELKEERRAELEEISLAAAHERNRRRVGAALEVLVDGPAEDLEESTQGRWRGQAPEVDGRVIIEGDAALFPGQLVSVVVTDAAPTELTARLADAERRACAC